MTLLPLSPRTVCAEEKNDRLVAAAVKFAEDIARKHDASAGVPIQAWLPTEFVLCAGQLPEYTFSASTEAAADGTRAFKCAIPWIEGVFMIPCELKFPTVPGLAHGLQFALASPGLVGKTLSVTAQLNAAAVAGKSAIKVTHLMIKGAAGDEGGVGGVPPAGDEGGGGGVPPAGNEGGGRGGGGGNDAPRVPSQFGPPVAVADVHAQLGCEAIPAAGAGDCFPLSAMCGFELTADAVEAPNGDATETVRLARVGSVDAVAGEGDLGGVAAATVRGEEGLPRAADEAEAKLGPWRNSFHWVTVEARLSAAFMFGMGVHLKRCVVVLELTPDGEKYLDPARAYAQCDEEGALMRTPAVPGKAETIPFYFTVKLANLPALLRAQTCSLVQFDRGGSHFQPLVREVAWTEVMDADDVAPMEEEEAAADAADEWQAVEGFWMATGVQGASTVDDLVPYRLQIPVDHHPLLQAGNEVRFQAPGADHSKVYVLPAGPFAEGKAFTFTVLLHPQVAMGDVSVTDLEVRVRDAADREVAAIADAALLADEEGEEAAPEAAIAAPSVAVIAAPAVATVAVVAAPAVAAPPAVATAVAAAPAVAIAAVAVAVEATPARAQKKRRGAANRALQAMDDQADDEDEGSRHEVKKVKRHQPPPKELTMAEALVGPFATLSPLETAPAWLGDALEPESGTAAQMLGKYVGFHWQDWGFAVGKLVAPTADDSNFGVLYSQWDMEEQTLTLEAYGVAGGAGSWVLLDGDLVPIEAYAGGKYKIGEAWFRAAQLPFYGDALRAARDAVRAAAAQQSQQDAEAELTTGGHAIGTRVFARGFDGQSTAWFLAEVVGHRARFPPLQIKYLATHPDGDASALALPVPRTAFVPATHVTIDEPMA